MKISREVVSDEHQCRCTIVYDGCRLGFTKKGKRSLQINAATTPFAFGNIVFKIRVRCADLTHSVYSFPRKRGASEICVKDNSSSVNDWLKSAGAEFIKGATNTGHYCVKLGDRAGRTNR